MIFGGVGRKRGKEINTQISWGEVRGRKNKIKKKKASGKD